MVLTPVRKQHIQGFALIEAMLALFVLTIGVLGVAGLQIRAMQSGSVAMQRTFVSMKTQELIERMLANPGLVTITRDMVAGSNNAIISSVTTDTVNNYMAAGYGSDQGCYTGTVCTPLQTAQQDIFSWRAGLNAFLPANPPPVYGVVVNPATNDVTLTVTWSDRGTQYSYAVTTQIQPLVLEKSS